MKNIKLIISCVIAAFCFTNVNAQALKIYKNDKTVITVSYNELDSIVAVEAEAGNHEFVDLGLSVKWATCNIGAEKPEDTGIYVAWGEHASKDTYDVDNSITTGLIIPDISGDAQYDAARASWGGEARIPTKEECFELLDKCTWQWTTKNGVSGMLVMGPNAKSIFLPASGSINSDYLSCKGDYGFYWSSTPFEDYDDVAFALVLCSDDYWCDWDYRKLGFNIRPVTK